MSGLSPRMRGNLIKPLALTARAGSIPTHAGKPIKVTLPYIPRWVYPHACGETPAEVIHRHAFEGLSPRMRGNLPSFFSPPSAVGSIPTHAGKPSIFFQPSFGRRVYPHACGETHNPNWKEFYKGGLSPRMRGNRYQGPPTALRCGSIPTHAGKPAKAERDHLCGRVYPHACGETHGVYRCRCNGQGLSPRMRGNRFILL